MDLNKQDEIFQAISDFYASELYALISRNLSTTPFMEVIGKSRCETSHSAFLQWLVSAKELHNSISTPLLSLLRLLAIRSQYNPGLMDKDLCQDILINNIELSEVESFTEEPTNSASGKGRADIVILATISYRNAQSEPHKRLRVVIENKIDSSEGEDQCKKYYEHYSIKKDTNYTIYAYLAPRIPKKLSSDHFIAITYQDVLNKVILPLLHDETTLPERSIMYIRMFVENITSIKNNSKIQIAMDPELKKMLANFYTNNEELILAAIEAGAPDEIKEKVKEAQVNRDYSSYILKYLLNGQQKTVHIKAKSRVAKAFVEAYCQQNPSVTLNKLQDILKSVKKDVISYNQKDRSETIQGHSDWYIETGIWGAKNRYFENLKAVISENNMELEQIQ